MYVVRWVFVHQITVIDDRPDAFIFKADKCLFSRKQITVGTSSLNYSASYDGQEKSSRNFLTSTVCCTMNSNCLDRFELPGQSDTAHLYVQVFQKKRRDKWQAGTVVSVSWQRTEPHIACCAAIPVITQPPYSPGLALSDCRLFPALKMGLKGTCFATMGNIKTAELRKTPKMPSTSVSNSGRIDGESVCARANVLKGD
jgi:hypothetical protein